MRFNKLDLNLLVALDALLVERNITLAANRMSLSQSAMSNALGRLRDYFEDDLLLQVGRKMELTPRAEVLQGAVREVLVRIDTSIAAVPEFDCRTSDREFTLCVSDYSMEMLVPHALAIAARQRSRARLRLVPQVSSPARALERGESDLLIIPKAHGSPEHPTQTLCTESFVCAVWRESALAREGLSYERYAQAGHVVMKPGRDEPPAFEDWFVKQHGLSRRIEVSTYSFTSQPFLVVGTEFVATLHASLGRRLQPALPIVLLPVPLPMPALEQSMQWHKYRSRDPGLAWLRELLAEAARALSDEVPPRAVEGQP